MLVRVLFCVEQVQTHDMKSVNEALNGIYIEDEDYTKLNASVSNYTNFDQVPCHSPVHRKVVVRLSRRITTALLHN